MPNPLDALKAYFSAPGDGTTSSFAPWQRTAQRVVEGGTQGLLGLAGLGDDSSSANRFGQLLAAGAPLLPKGLGAANPLFTAVGAEGDYNAGKQGLKVADPLESTYQRMLASGKGNRGATSSTSGKAVIGRNSTDPHPAIRALLDTLSSQPESLDPAKVFVQEKVGGFQVPHRGMIVPPEGFELPPGTSPYPARSPELIDQFNLRRDSSLGRSSDYRANGSKPATSLKGLPRTKGVSVDPGAEFQSKFALSGLGSLSGGQGGWK